MAALLSPCSADAQDGSLMSVIGFTVTIEGSPSADGAWRQTTGGEQAIELIEQDGRVSLGKKHVGEVALGGPMTTGRLVQGDWLNATISGRESGRAVAVTAILKDGSPGEIQTYYEAFPVRYVFPHLRAAGTGPLEETLVLKANRVEWSGATRGATSTSGEILENGAGRFRVEIVGAATASSNIAEVRFDDLVIDAQEVTMDRSTDRVYVPGEPHWGNVSLTAKRTTHNELFEWWTDTANGQILRRDISVVVLDRAGVEARRYQVFGCLPTSYRSHEFSPDEIVATETLVCQPTRIEFF